MPSENTFKLWFLLSEPSQKKLRKLMPKGWKPPRREKIKNPGLVEEVKDGISKGID